MIWSNNALANLTRIHVFLFDRDPSVANRAIVAIRDGVRMLDELPKAGRPVHGEDGDVRDWTVHFGRQGYKVRYLYENESVTILAVRHMRESEFRIERIP